MAPYILGKNGRAYGTLENYADYLPWVKTQGYDNGRPYGTIKNYVCHFYEIIFEALISHWKGGNRGYNIGSHNRTTFWTFS